MSLDLMDAAASGMDAQRAALDVAARNVAAAQAADRNGTYTREIPEFRVTGDGASALQFVGTHEQRGANPSVVAEMVDVMNASRAYESQAALFDAGKTLAEKTIQLGRV